MSRELRSSAIFSSRIPSDIGRPSRTRCQDLRLCVFRAEPNRLLALCDLSTFRESQVVARPKWASGYVGWIAIALVELERLGWRPSDS
jgi:hypothetical protein